MIKTQHCPNCEATEQKLHDFRQEVSDIVKAYTQNLVNYDEDAWENLKSLIILAPKPDPLDRVLSMTSSLVDKETLRDRLEAEGLEIREKNDGQ